MEITTWYLEQTDPSELRPATAHHGAEVRRAELVSPELNRYLYTAVGGDWYWRDRLSWDWQRWHDWLDRPGAETWVAHLRGTPVGYAELDGHVEGEVELPYFGILPSFVGQGLGGHLLTMALRRAWNLAERWPALRPPHRLWVHTCSLDGPAALANYQARGLRIYRTEIGNEDVPAIPPGPWPDAGALPG
jgi:GNAT superfamily N-acetyltransferase